MAKLTHNEIEALMKFRFSAEKSENHLTLTGLELINSDRLQILIDNYLQAKLNTDKQSVIGSMIVKSYAFLAALVLHSMSVFDKGLDSSLENISIQTEDSGPFWLPSFYFYNLNVTTPDAGYRDQWRSDVVKLLFTENFSRVITSISKQLKVSKAILWENTATYIFWMYETLLEDASLSDEMKAKIEDDFQFIIHEAVPELFATKSRNPITQFYLPKQDNIRMRKTCCLFYLTSSSRDRCSTCPIECKK